MLLSIVVPCFNEEEALPLFYDEITKMASKMLYVDSQENEYTHSPENRIKESLSLEFEFVFIDDGSSDNTLQLFRELREKDRRVRYLSFSRNFGKEAALYAGLQSAKGNLVVVMDVDLQDPPALLPEMYRAIADEGYDCVGTRRVTRKGEPPLRSFFARRFYRLINRISKVDFVDGARDFRMMTRQYVDAVCEIAEYNRFSKGIFSWVGFRTKWLEYENVERVAGETKWSFWKLFLYSIEGVVAYSTIPLAISSVMGVFFCLVSLLAMGFFVVRTLIWGDPVAGFPTLVSVILLLGGLQLSGIGVLGGYLSKTYLETKRRPIYVVKSRESDDN